jgi:hypothetical protein
MELMITHDLTPHLARRRLSNASLKGFIAPELGQLTFLQELYVLFHCAFSCSLRDLV